MPMRIKVCLAVKFLKRLIKSGALYAIPHNNNERIVKSCKKGNQLPQQPQNDKYANNSFQFEWFCCEIQQKIFR